MIDLYVIGGRRDRDGRSGSRRTPAPRRIRRGRRTARRSSSRPLATATRTLGDRRGRHGQRNLTTTPTGVTSIDPSWSPDGSQIVFSRTDGPTNIWKMDADGTGAVPLTESTFNRRPAWSPDGARIAFARGGECGRCVPTAPRRPCTRATWSTPAASTGSPSKAPDPEPRRIRRRRRLRARRRPPTGKDGTGGPGSGIGGAIGALWEGGGPPAATCAKSSVRFGDVEAIAACFSPKGKANVATGRVRVNGLDILPSGGTRSRSTRRRGRIQSRGPCACSPGRSRSTRAGSTGISRAAGSSCRSAATRPSG